MSEFISAADAIESGVAADQKKVRDEVADITARLRRAMDAGLTPEDMKAARAAKAASDAAQEILSNIF